MSKRDPYEIRHLLPALAPKPQDVRTRDHRCGNCSWGGTGRIDCKNRNPKTRFQQICEALAAARGEA